MSVDSSLSELREAIDELDSKLLTLFNERANLAKDVATVKLRDGASVDFYRPDREASVLRRVQEKNPGPLKDEDVARIYRELMSSCLAVEKPLTIAFLGPSGTFTQEAALKHFGHAVHTLEAATISDIFHEVDNGDAHYGVVPVENSTEGVINHTLDTFMNSSLQICGEVALRIHHHLLSTADSLADVKVVYSHQQSLAQCRQWLVVNLPSVEIIAVSSNAEAARLAHEEKGAAAIAGEIASDIYHLNKLASHIEDEPNNTTRFLVLGKQRVPASGDDKTSMMISTKNVAGALQAALAPFAYAGISLNKIESRPSRQGAWDYVFFVDIDGHQDDEKVAAVLQELQPNVNLLKVIGSYPRAVI
ncbi:MAG: prephenate dehydratase [Cycloclasticus sp. symbiont of Bathymodiolus heckerae]|nr:MAG: prephenate dehydratase [Cycloclasticus sp. symbiont of Bathymodiolus heckerae]